MKKLLVKKIEEILPQTQCGKCNFDDCRSYALAVANDDAEINQCPPGGAVVIESLAKLLNKAKILLNPNNGVEKPYKEVALIIEKDCIGCTLCIKACPTDAILGSGKFMHTVISNECTGCELCIAPCPIDCIVMVKHLVETTNKQKQSEKYRNRYYNRKLRLEEEQLEIKRKRELRRSKLRRSKKIDYDKSNELGNIDGDYYKNLIAGAIERSKKKKNMKKTLYDKIFERHTVKEENDGTVLLYIDRHLIHEVTSPQAFEGLEIASRNLWRANSILGVPDHNVPTENRNLDVSGITDPIAKIQVTTLNENCDKFGVRKINLTDIRQGIVHVVGPEQGATLPGMTVVCGDSHTSTHGAFGALAFGIGTSEVEHVMATQTVHQTKAKSMRIIVDGEIQKGVSAKDIILAIIAKIGTDGGTGYTIEFAGSAISDLSMEGRMTICNMAIEAGARSGLIAVDKKTIDYVIGRPFAPTGDTLEKAINYWETLHSDEDAVFDKEVFLDAKDIEPQVSWGTSPEMVVSITNVVPYISEFTDTVKAEAAKKALEYMDLTEGQPITSINLDKIFIGSCTNSRIEDLRIAAKIVKGKKIASTIKQAMVVAGSGLVKAEAEREGLDKIFIEAGFLWRDPGCSMCLAMNTDKLGIGEHCASTSNRNFEGRQGIGGRTHLVSPAMAAAAAIAGHFVDVRDLL